MAKGNLSGIEDFFEDLDEPSVDESSVKVRDERTPPKKRPTSAARHQDTARQGSARNESADRASDPEPRQPVRLPRGRRPGKQDADGPRRTKASLWLDADLLDAYRERVYTERCHLGELVERALQQYRQENW